MDFVAIEMLPLNRQSSILSVAEICKDVHL